MGSIQLGPTLTWWTWTTSLLTSVGLYKSFTRMTWGKFRAEEVASMVRESTCVFPLLGMCNRLKDSNSDCKWLTWLKYPCILLSLASNSPFTWPTTNLEFENIFTAFLPILWTMTVPISRASYSTSLFVPKNPNLNDFSMVIFMGETGTSPLWILFDSLCHQHIPSKLKVLIGWLCQPIFHLCVVFLPLSQMGIQRTRPLNLQGPGP